MHLSYIITVLASIGTTVQAISESQQLEPSTVVTPNVAQSVESTHSAPRGSKRSLRVQKQEEDKSDGESKIDGFASTEEDRDVGAMRSFLGTYIGGYFPSGVGKVKTALQSQTGAISNKLNQMPEALVAEPQVLQHIVKKAPELDLVNPQQVRGQQSMKEMIKGPKNAHPLSKDQAAVLEPYIKFVTEYSTKFHKEDWTAAQFHSVWKRDFQKTRADINPETLYSLLYRGRVLDDLEDLNSPAVEAKFKDMLNKIVDNPITLKKFGRVMQETENLDDASLTSRRMSGKSSPEKDGVNLVIDFRGALDRAAFLHGDRLTQAVKQEWGLTRTKKSLGITDDTPLDDKAYTEMRNIIVARLLNDKLVNGRTSAIKNEASDVVDDLIKHPLARKYLSHALDEKSLKGISTQLGVDKPGSDPKDIEEALHSLMVLKRFHDLHLDM